MSDGSAKNEMKIDRLSFKKIFFHTDRLYNYLKSGDEYPIHLVIGFTDYCNQDCLYCYTAYSTRDNIAMNDDGTIVKVAKTAESRMISREALVKFLAEAREKGLKAVTIVGSGEPLLHPEAAEILTDIARLGIKFGIFTNGQTLPPRVAEVIVAHGTFVRISLDAANPDTHKVMRGKGGDFEQVLRNLKTLLALRAERGGMMPTIGAQFVTCQLNADNMVPFTKLMRKIGLDYVTFKPMYNNPLNVGQPVNTMSVEEALAILKRLKRYETASFNVYDKEGEQFRNAWVPQKNNGAEYYQKCMGHQFSPVVYSNGDMFVCLNLGGHREFIIGNIYTQGIEDIWKSKQRRGAIANIDLVNKCPARCKLDPLNKILWDITHPDEEIHPDFF